MGLLDFVKKLVKTGQKESVDLLQNVSQTTRDLVEPLRGNLSDLNAVRSSQQKPSPDYLTRVSDSANLSPKTRQVVGSLGQLAKKEQKASVKMAATKLAPLKQKLV